jgi:polyhydroxyalkanoate synthesis regulator phasin
MSNKRRKGSALKKASNTRSRKDVIEAHYVDGVYDKDGELVIRPCSQEEKDWLEQFYEETVVTNFLHGKGMREKSREIKNLIECDEYKKYHKLEKSTKDKKEKAQYAEMKKLIRKQNMEVHECRISMLREQLQDLRDKYLMFSDPEEHKKFYRENNKRNNDLLNNVYVQEITPEIVDELYLETMGDIDFEEDLIESIDWGDLTDLEEGDE